MNALLASALQSLTELVEHGRLFLDALSLHAPGALSAVAVLALCATAAVVTLDASRRTLAVPTWSYLRREVAHLAADRDGKKDMVDSLRAECEALAGELDTLRSEKRRLAGVTERREEQEAALRDLSDRLSRMDDDCALADAIRAELDGLKSDKAALQQQVAAFQAQRAEHECEIARLQERKTELADDVSGLVTSRDAASMQVNQLKLEAETLLRQVEAAHAALREAEHKSRNEGDALDALHRERERLDGQVAALQGRVEQLERTRQDIETGIAAAQGRRARLLEAKGRLEADRSALWMEFITLQEKRNASIRDASVSEARVRELRQQRDALHSEIEMLKRALVTLDQRPEVRP
jgi:chromosome segregation ATPase